MQQHNLFPYEEKGLLEICNKILSEQTFNDKELQKVVVYYKNHFYITSLKRFLKKQVTSFKLYSKMEDMYLGRYDDYFEEGLGDDYFYDLDESYEKYYDSQRVDKYIFGLETYDKDHPDDGYKEYIKTNPSYQDSPYLKLRYALKYLENPFLKVLSKARYKTLVDNIVCKNEKKENEVFFADYINEKSIDVIRVFDEEVNECLREKMYDFHNFEQLIKLNEIEKIDMEKLNKITTFCSDSRQIENLRYLIEKHPEYTIDSLDEYYQRCVRFQAIMTKAEAHINLYDYINMCDCIAIKPDYYPNSLLKVYKRTAKIYNALHIERNVLRIDKLYDYEDDKYIIKQAIDDEKFNKIKDIFNQTFLEFNNNCYYLYSKEDKNKEIAIIQTTDNKEKLNDRGIYAYMPYLGRGEARTNIKPTKDTVQFIKKWLNHNKQLNTKHLRV